MRIIRKLITSPENVLAGCFFFGGLMAMSVSPAFGACTTNADTRPSIPTPSAGEKIHQLEYRGQTITVTGTGCFKLDQVTISLLKSGSPGNLVVDVYSATLDSNSKLVSVGLLLGTSDQVTPGSVGSALADVTIPFTAKPTLFGGSAYLFVAHQVANAGSGTNYYKLGLADNNPYASGEHCKSADAGTTWNCPGSNQGTNPGSEDVRMSICLSPCTTTSGCTLTQGAYKTHPAENFPDGFTTLALGATSYTQTQLVAIYDQPVAGNGLIALAHQLITAKLNQLKGASVPAGVATAIAAADALIGAKVVPPIGADSLDPSATSSLVCTLTIYNSGCSADGPPHCGSPETCPSCTP